MWTFPALKGRLITADVAFDGFGLGEFTGKSFTRDFALILGAKFGGERCSPDSAEPLAEY